MRRRPVDQPCSIRKAASAWSQVSRRSHGERTPRPQCNHHGSQARQRQARRRPQVDRLHPSEWRPGFAGSFCPRSTGSRGESAAMVKRMLGGGRRWWPPGRDASLFTKPRCSAWSLKRCGPCHPPPPDIGSGDGSRSGLRARGNPHCPFWKRARRTRAPREGGLRGPTAQGERSGG